MAKSDGIVYVDTLIDTKGFGKGVNTMQKQISGLGGAIGKLGATIAATFAVGKLIQFGKEAIQLGSDLEEVQNVVDVTFTTMNEQVNEFARNAAESAGLSETMAKRYVGTFGAMSKAFGFAENEAFEMSTALTQLAGDVASFYNISQDEAYTKLKSVFTGETETLKDLGVVMTQNALDSYAMAKGYGKTTKAMTEQEKVALRYAFVQDQLSAAQGDFVRTSDSWANQMKILSLAFDSFKANIGQALINIFTPFLKVINQIVDKMVQLSERFVAFSELIVGKSTSGGGGSPGDNLAGIQDGYEDIAETIDEATKAQNKYFTGLDEIKTFQTQEGTNNGAGGGIGAINPNETEQVNENIEKTESLIDKVINKIIELIKNEDWEGLGTYISNGIVLALDFLSEEISEFDWEGFGEDIGDFIKGIEWGDILCSVGELIWDAINAGIDIFKGMFDAAPIETAILLAIAALKFPGLRSILANKIQTAFPSAITIGKAITITLAVVTIAFEVSKAISKALLKRSNEKFGTNYETDFIDNLGFKDIFLDLGPQVFQHFLQNPMFTLDMWAQLLFGKPTFKELIDELIDENAFLNKITDICNSIHDGTKENLSNIIDIFKTGFEKHIFPWLSKEKWAEAMGGIKEAFDNTWKGAVNVAIEILNKFIDCINDKMHFEWEPIKILGKEIVPGGNVQLFTVPKIPMLATGAVIPPNAPFMAMLGDQKHGTNIEAPLDTIKQAVREVIGNGNGGGQYRFTAQINRRTLFDEMIEEAKLRQSSAGRNPFDLKI